MDWYLIYECHVIVTSCNASDDAPIRSSVLFMIAAMNLKIINVVFLSYMVLKICIN